MDPCTRSHKLLIGMKLFPFRSRSPRCCVAAVATCLCLICFGCRPPTQAEVVGTYTRSYRGVSDTLLLNPDGTFRQNVIYTNGGTWSTSGSWKLKYRALQLDRYYMTFDDEKGTIITPPRDTSMFTFLIQNGALSKSKLQPPWLRQK